MTHTYKFTHYDGEYNSKTYDKYTPSESDVFVVRLEFGSDGKLLNSSICKQSGEFEPTFTLRGGDIMASSTVRHYSDMLDIVAKAQENGLKSEGGECVSITKQKAISARAMASTFENYEGPKKIAD